MVTTTSNGLAPYSDIAMRSAIEAHMKQRHWEVRDLAYAMGVSLGVTERWLAGDTAQTIFRAKLRRYLEGLGYPNTTSQPAAEPEPVLERMERDEAKGAAIADRVIREMEEAQATVVTFPPAADDQVIVTKCRGCGCTDDDCSDCVERTGEPCHWVEPDLCSACATVAIAEPDGDGGLPPGFSILRPAMAATTIRPAGISISSQYDRASLSKALVAALGHPSHVLVATDAAGCQLLIYAARGAGDGVAMRVNKAGDVSMSVARWAQAHEIDPGFYEAKRDTGGLGWRVVFIEF